ncbi:hypothetical protein GCM10010512_08740 [Streptomyces thermoviolaceus subsp. thermoviolaceus]|nr:hypothetical protein GCM10010512_08740 [Streptomyces thermoviolaceus subsp. thermoviolaceus]
MTSLVPGGEAWATVAGAARTAVAAAARASAPESVLLAMWGFFLRRRVASDGQGDGRTCCKLSALHVQPTVRAPLRAVNTLDMNLSETMKGSWCSAGRQGGVRARSVRGIRAARQAADPADG